MLAVGGPEQIAALDAVQDAGQLGCFALTEKLAGVQSGLVVETQASYDAKAQEFVLHTPSEGAAKNWISQGFTADKAAHVDHPPTRPPSARLFTHLSTGHRRSCSQSSR